VNDAIQWEGSGTRLPLVLRLIFNQLVLSLPLIMKSLESSPKIAALDGILFM